MKKDCPEFSDADVRTPAPHREPAPAAVRVLFVCIHNSARSQMAEAFANHYGKGRVAAQSAGMEPGRLNRQVVQVMQEIGIDISTNGTKGVQQMLRKDFDAVITVCDEATAECCPVFPGDIKRLHWSFPDPSAFQGSEVERLERTRAVRDQIEAKVREWLANGQC